MRVPKGLQKLLENFVFRDARLESHPKIAASHVYLASDESHLDLVARVSKNRIRFEEHRIDTDRGLMGYVWRKKQGVVVADVNPPDTHFNAPELLKPSSVRSFIAAPF